MFFRTLVVKIICVSVLSSLTDHSLVILNLPITFQSFVVCTLNHTLIGLGRAVASVVVEYV